MSFRPKYKKELFCEEYFTQILAEAKKITANVWFLQDSDIKIYEHNKIIIYLAHGGKNYLEEAAKFVDLLKKIIADEFDFTADIELGGVTALYKNDDKDRLNTAENILKIEEDVRGAARRICRERSSRKNARGSRKAENPAGKNGENTRGNKRNSQFAGISENRFRSAESYIFQVG
jgi:hypothetical protein